MDSKNSINPDREQTPEQMVQAIFKSWFVDFEPVKAKMAARKRWRALQPGNESASPVCYAPEPQGQPLGTDLETCMDLAAIQAISGETVDQLTRLRDQQPEQYAELCTIAALFPSAMQESELGEIPEGWKVVPFGEAWLYHSQSAGISNFLAGMFSESELVIVPTKDMQLAFYGRVRRLIQRWHSD